MLSLVLRRESDENRWNCAWNADGRKELSNLPARNRPTLGGDGCVKQIVKERPATRLGLELPPALSPSCKPARLPPLTDEAGGQGKADGGGPHRKSCRCTRPIILCKLAGHCRETKLPAGCQCVMSPVLCRNTSDGTRYCRNSRVREIA